MAPRAALIKALSDAIAYDGFYRTKRAEAVADAMEGYFEEFMKAWMAKEFGPCPHSEAILQDDLPEFSQGFYPDKDSKNLKAMNYRHDLVAGKSRPETRPWWKKSDPDVVELLEASVAWSPDLETSKHSALCPKYNRLIDAYRKVKAKYT